MLVWDKLQHRRGVWEAATIAGKYTVRLATRYFNVRYAPHNGGEGVHVGTAGNLVEAKALADRHVADRRRAAFLNASKRQANGA